MNCPRCGASEPDPNAEFCGICGKPLKDTALLADLPATQPVLPPTLVDQGYAGGEPLSPTIPVHSANRPGSKRRVAPVVTSIVALCLVVLLIAVLALNNQSKSTPPRQQLTQQQIASTQIAQAQQTVTAIEAKQLLPTCPGGHSTGPFNWQSGSLPVKQSVVAEVWYFDSVKQTSFDVLLDEGVWETSGTATEVQYSFHCPDIAKQAQMEHVVLMKRNGRAISIIGVEESGFYLNPEVTP